MERSEKILICISGAPSNSKVIRAGAKIAKAFNGSLCALFVQPSNFEQFDLESKQRLTDNIRLAQHFGAQVTTLYGEDAATQIAEYARVSGTTKIVLGKSPSKRGLFPSKNLIDRLNELAPDIDVFVIPDTSSAEAKAKRRNFSDEHFSAADVVKTIAILTLCTLIGFAFTRFGFSTANVIVVYILGVLGIAMTTRGRSYSLLTSILSVLIFNFFFTAPYFSLFADPSHIATFIIMFIAAFLISSLTTRIKQQTILTAQRAYRTEILLETSQKLQKAENEEEILSATAAQLGRLLEKDIVIYPVRNNELQEPLLFPEYEGKDLEGYLKPEERSIAEWVLKNNRQAGKSTSNFPESHGLYMAIRGAKSVLAVVCVALDKARGPEGFEKTLMVTILDECGIILESEYNTREKREIEEKARTEELRANLLRSISHDLRTPLTGISGNAALLMENELNEATRKSIYSDIYDDSQWLINLVENLLSITRIEADGKLANTQPELVGDVIRDALAHIDRNGEKHNISVEIDNDYLMAYIDVRLIIQVLINLVNNAVKYTPEGSCITVSAEDAGDLVQIRIADDGSGIPPESKAKIFDMFYTGSNAGGDSRRGLGLGLALCKSIVLAHGGTISVSDNKPHGAVFTFTLPKAEVKENE
ncbi:MAG: DUF4118 domain-containing protein [Bacillota bacterium]|nr:DUF4118 domain-containing protein [Bacillota bacterium]